MLTIHDTPKKNKVFKIDHESPKPLSLAGLRPRSRRAKKSVLIPQIKPTKILTITDLPRRGAGPMRGDATRIRRPSPTMKGTVLGPKKFSDYVRNNAWKGRRCFIIGGGPSLKNVDLDLLRNEITIGINRAYEKLTPSILFGVDPQMWGWVEQGKCGEESKRKFNEYKGYKVWMALLSKRGKMQLFPPDFYLVDEDDRGGYKIGTTDLLSFKNNSGYGAINLAAALGANPIYLLGFDMQGDKQGKQKWWHDGYPIDYGEGVYPTYIDEINGFAPELKRAGFEVINLNPKSALKCFPFGEYRKVVADKSVIPEGSIQVMEKPGTITAITPTGDRPLAFELCKQWMRHQTVKPDQWIVVDDGKTPLKPASDMDYIRRNPRHNDPKQTLIVNMREALKRATGNRILIIEDDEYYAPGYVERMSKELDIAEVAGIMRAKYYHLPTGGYQHIPNMAHASLAQTGFRKSFIPKVIPLLRDGGKLYLDMDIWRVARQTCTVSLILDDKESLYAGIKGMAGRGGIGSGHNPISYASHDTNRNILKKWIPKDYQVYLDIISGTLTNATCKNYFPEITGITVSHNTKDLLKRSYESVRKFHPNMPIIIIDGSDKKDPCAAYAKSLASPLTTVYSPGYNIGHGRGMCMGIDKARTPYALIFDSDIEMLKSPVDAMFAMMESNTYGVGYTEKTAPDGYEWGAGGTHNKGEPMRMLHPYFQLLNIANYMKFHPYVHHGAPCYLAARDIHEQGLSNTIIKEFPGLGHSSGKGWVWEGKEREYIRHDPAGTRHTRSKAGQPEIEGDWVKK